MLKSIMRALSDPSFYPHAVDSVEIVETHISVVFLAGDFAYKMKKPLNLGFLDFSNLQKRKYFCEQELHLNKKFAPDLYLELVTVGWQGNGYVYGGCPAVEYLVKMKRFSDSQQLDRMVERGLASDRHFTAFAKAIAVIHHGLPRADPSGSFGTVTAIRSPVEENFEQISSSLLTLGLVNDMADIVSWSLDQCDVLAETFVQRLRDGYVRECHGDMHLRNMAWVGDAPVLFDCIEFSRELRWIDVMNDVAFLLMDLDDRQRSHEGWLFLNRYLDENADYQGTALLSFYRVYRAMVRAKVTAIQMLQIDPGGPQFCALQSLFASYLELARTYTHKKQPLLVMTHGFSGSGKTYLADRLAPQIGAIRLSSDRERKRAGQDFKSPTSESYSAEARHGIYSQLMRQTANLIDSGFSVIVDATFLNSFDRESMFEMAGARYIEPIILDLDVADEVIRKRLRVRGRASDSFSDADEAVYFCQKKQNHPLVSKEQACSVRVTSDTEIRDVAEMIRTKSRQ